MPLKRISLLFLLLSPMLFSQVSIGETLKKYNTNSVAYISVEELADLKAPILLDARKKEEFNVSHLSDACWAGYEDFKLERIQNLVPDTTATIVVYCSIGVRSEDIGEKLKKAGYSNVKNLYGGIFEWKSKGNRVYDTLGKPTEKVHAYSKQWGKLLTNAQKVYPVKHN